MSDKTADELLTTIRAVVREELDKMQQRAEAAQQQATQELWDSPEFKAQVDDLREGRPVKSDFGGLGPCLCGDVDCQD